VDDGLLLLQQCRGNGEEENLFFLRPSSPNVLMFIFNQLIAASFCSRVIRSIARRNRGEKLLQHRTLWACVGASGFPPFSLLLLVHSSSPRYLVQQQSFPIENVFVLLLYILCRWRREKAISRERERGKGERERLDITLSIKCTRVLVVQIWKINVTRDTESERERASERWQGSMIDSSIAKGFLFALARIAHSITPIIDFLFGVLNVKLDAIH
jgi:hypothetical protein